MEKEEKNFNVDYRGWIVRKRRTFYDVRDIFDYRGEEWKMFDEWADTAKFGDKISIGGINIECVPSMYEISKRCRYYIHF